MLKSKRILVSKKYFYMLISRILFLVVSLTFISSTYSNEPRDEVPPPYANMKKIIKEKYDSRAVFSWNKYLELLGKLSQDRFIVLPLNEMRKTFNDSKIIVGLRHDVDFNPFKALDMAKIEKGYGLRATYFLLATAEYSGTFKNSSYVRTPGMGTLYKELHKTGAEIGIHNDLVSVMILYDMDPLKFNRDELSYFRSLKIPIYGTASHGSEIAKVTVPNYQIFSDFAKKDSVRYKDKMYPIGINSLKDYKFLYEAYFIKFNQYFSDSAGKWNDKEGFEGIMNKLDSCKPGDRVQILVHPDWWGKAK